MSTIHEAPEVEKLLYYCGISGRQYGPGPKLVYRTSADVFAPVKMAPYANGFDPGRVMQLFPVYEHSQLSKDDAWNTIRGEVVKLLDNRQIQFTSVDLARFGWDHEHEKGVTTRVTIFIGVLPDTTSGEAAFNSSQDILKLLQQHEIDDLDVAFRESVVHPLVRTELFAPVENASHPLKDVVDPLTTSLSLSIAGLKTPHMEGALGFYFRIGQDLYGVTARHVLFPAKEGNYPYKYVDGAPKKEVVLMGTRAFEDFEASIRNNIRKLEISVFLLEESVTAERRNADPRLAATEASLKSKKEALEAVQEFYANTSKLGGWSYVSNRVIGHVVWAPPITGNNVPYGYTKDVCVIKLDNRKFAASFKGNLIDTGAKTLMEECHFISRMYPHDISELDICPIDRFYKLKHILTAAQIKQPDNKDVYGYPVQYVFKNGPATGTTTGRLNGFDSYVRHYSLVGSFDSIDVAVFPDEKNAGSFSKEGDSGALIAGAHNRFGLQLTGGAGSTESIDITYGTPMFWLWDSVIKPEFPDATLHFDAI